MSTAFQFIRVEASDGREYTQIVKGKDDLRLVSNLGDAQQRQPWAESRAQLLHAVCEPSRTR